MNQVRVNEDLHVGKDQKEQRWCVDWNRTYRFHLDIYLIHV